MQTIMSMASIAVPSVIGLLIVIYLLSLRRIVPTNVVHIVQRGDKTVSYGVGKGSNVYYEFPKWIPKIGVEVRILPVSNFDIDLAKYSAYDKDRVPFVVDVKAFFHISDTNKAAEKVESFAELKKQLENVVQGSVRSILAKSKLEEIMEERSVFGERFTENVKHDLQNWGVEAIKNIELMDIRDAEGSNVIHQIMAKRMSAIDMESRTEVAKNSKMAKQAELEAKKEIEVTTAETEKIAGEAQAQSQQAIGIAKAEAMKKTGIAEQQSISEIARAERATAEQQMEVVKVNQVKQAEIDREREIITAEQEKQKTEIRAEADKFRVETEAAALLEAKRKEAEAAKTLGTAEAEVIKAKGISEAESRKAMELASVMAQTTLAKEIGENKPYQEYLIRVKEVEVSQVVGVAQYESMAKALSTADLKLLVNSGDVHSGIGKLSDLFTSKGASQLNGLIEGLKQTDQGNGLMTMLNSLTGNGNSKDTQINS
jgi:flotillin